MNFYTCDQANKSLFSGIFQEIVLFLTTYREVYNFAGPAPAPHPSPRPIELQPIEPQHMDLSH